MQRGGSLTLWEVAVHPNFAPFFLGNLVSNCGTWFQNIAQAILVFRLTHSPLWLGVVNFSQFAGIFVLAPWAGSAADRYDRRRILLVTQLSATAITGTLAVLTLGGLATPPVIVAFALALGATNAFANPAMGALLPALVPREGLASAVTLNSLTFNLARAVGPVLGAVVIAHVGIAAAFGLNALSYLVLAAGVAVTRPRPQDLGRRDWPAVRETVRIVVRDPRLLALLGTVTIVSVAADPVNTLTPAFATTVLHRPDTWAGALVGGFGTGAVLAAVVFAWRTSDSDREALRGIAACLVLLGCGVAVFAASSVLPLSLGGLVVGGFGYLSAQTLATARLQLVVDEDQRGRIMALWSLAFLGTRPMASLLDGGLATTVGLRWAGTLMAVPAVLGALFLAWWTSRWPR